MEKSRSQKSCDTVPLKSAIFRVLDSLGLHFLYFFSAVESAFLLKNMYKNMLEQNRHRECVDHMIDFWPILVRGVTGQQNRQRIIGNGVQKARAPQNLLLACPEY